MERARHQEEADENEMLGNLGGETDWGGRGGGGGKSMGVLNFSHVYSFCRRNG